MGQKSKVGKQRKDKFYRLAKESGFRSRAAFKLLQLNRKFGFLQNARVLIDLCAAPGGWMQVAQQNMPVSSVIVGVDLYPIKAIPGCIGITEDITSDKCRVELTKALQNWKADVVLNDGAPNVGANWLFDAYQQACLTLSALKLATEFLKEGGWFVTKIFRSKDYNPLLWVLKQLFKKVHATKPQASRNESAEIFVVCQYYKAPDKLDPKFLQSNYVFKELETDPANQLNLFKPDKKGKKPKADGYAEGDYTLFHSLKAKAFINHENTIAALQDASEIVIEDDEVGMHEKTTSEIRECCKDIRVLGRKELRMLIAWAKVVKESLPSTSASEQPQVTKVETKKETDEEDEEMNDMDKHVQSVHEEEIRTAKKKRKAANKERMKLQEKMNLKMVLKGDEGPRLEADENMFDLKKIRSGKSLKKVSEQRPDILAESESDSDAEFRIKPKVTSFDRSEGHLDSSGRFYKSDESEPEESESEDEESVKDGLGLSDVESDAEDEGAHQQKESRNPLLTDLDYRGRKEKRTGKVAMWFQKDAFNNLETEVDEDFELDQVTEMVKRSGGKLRGETQMKTEIKAEADPDGDDDDESSSDSSSDESDYTESKKKAKKARRRGVNQEGEGFEVVSQPKGKSKKRKLDEEGLAIGTLMVSSKKKKRDLVDDAWNRYSFNDENLPDWFVEDEKKHMRKELPVPAELVEEYRSKLKEINARPMKKVIEAKARKKRRAVKKLEKAKKKAEAIMDNPDVTDREKARQVQKLYKKAQANPKKEVTYVVSKKHTTSKRAKRPAGLKGHYKVVDPRLKKDNRKKKAEAKKQKRGKGRGGTGGRGRRKK